MATTLEAILNIRTQVTGEGQLAGLQSKLGAIERTAATATTGFSRFAGSSGVLTGALGTLTPYLSGAGLLAMATNALNAGDEIHDLSQKTGISVEALAKFKKAAATSGTDLNTVAKSINILSKNMLTTAQTGKGPAADAFRTLGISITDANGKLKATDAVVLEVANKFKNMPQGPEKTALAMRLFGRSGAEIVPMLNMGGVAIDKLKVKMTAAFAQKADEYKDKLNILGSKVQALGVDLMIALLPALEAITDVIVKSVDAFNGLDPGIRNVIVAVGLFAIAWGPVSAVLGGVLSAIGGLVTGISFFSGVVASLGGIVPTIAVAFEGLMGILGGIGPLLVGIFTGPIGWVALIVGAGIALWAFRDKIGQFLSWIAQGFANAFKALGNVLPGIGQMIWNSLSSAFNFAKTAVTDFLTWYYNTFMAWWVKPLAQAATAIGQWLAQAWEVAKTAVSNFLNWYYNTFMAWWIKPLSQAASSIGQWLGQAWEVAKTAVSNFLNWYYNTFMAWWVKPLAQAATAIGQWLGQAWEVAKTAVSNFLTWYTTNFMGSWFKPLQQAANAIGQWLGNAWQIAQKAVANFLGWFAQAFATNWLKPLQQAATAVGKWLGSAWQTAQNAILTFFKWYGQMFANAWNAPLKAAASFIGNTLVPAWQAFQKWISGAWQAIGSTFRRFVTDPILKAWDFIVSAAKAPIRGLLTFAASMVNSVISLINRMISGINFVRSRVGLSTFGYINLITVPAFASGGYVNGPTVGLIGEAGPEYVIPAKRMASASRAYLSGARGASVLSSSGGSINPQVNITTGPVMQQNGQNYITLDDGQRIARETASQLMRQLRTPSARMALGIR